jgi:hypothetical protein
MEFGQWRAMAVVTVALAIGAVLLLRPWSGEGHTSGKGLDGGSFTTTYPPGWGLTVRHGPEGAARYQISSNGAPVSGLGIGPPGTIAITIDETPASLLSKIHLAGGRPDPAAAIQSSLELLPQSVGTPTGALEIVHTEFPRPTYLDGADAAREAYTYLWAGHRNVQVDVLSHRGGALFLLELDTEPPLAQQGRAALEALTSDWRWH